MKKLSQKESLELAASTLQKNGASRENALPLALGIIDAEKGVLIQRPGNKVIQLYEQLTLTSSRPSKVKEKYHLKNVSSNNSVLLQTVINNLGQNIILGKYATGEKMPVEHELAASINVGRNILREAIKILSDKGLLSTGPRRGTLVQPRNNWNLLDKDVLSWMITCFDSSSKFLSFTSVGLIGYSPVKQWSVN